MKKLIKVLGILAGCIALFLIYVQLTFKQKFVAPLTGIRASTDSSIIRRGEYLVMGPTHCYACHGSPSSKAPGIKGPLMGGKALKTPFATFYVPNITPDEETGIGLIDDEYLATAIRYNINHRGEAMVPYMSFNIMSDDDVRAIISYLRSTAPIKNKVPSHDVNMIGKIIMRFMMKPNIDVKQSTLKPDTTAEYGKYIAYTIGQCNSCHTARDKMGKFIGEPFAGGFSWDLEDAKYTSANLTPHDSTGRIAKWSEQAFIDRFRAGRVLPGSPMPWEGYSNLTENDLKALYRFLRTLPAVRNNFGQTYIPKKAVEQNKSGI